MQVAKILIVVSIMLLSRLLDAIDPAYAQNLTLYHEFQPQYEYLGLENQVEKNKRSSFVYRIIAHLHFI